MRELTKSELDAVCGGITIGNIALFSKQANVTQVNSVKAVQVAVWGSNNIQQQNNSSISF
jgi:hypothetical protein